MSARLFMVDTENTGPSPYSGVTTEFGVVDFTTRATFHAHLWDFHYEPGNPVPIPDRFNPGWTATLPAGAPDNEHFNGVRFDGHWDDDTLVYAALTDWIAALAEHAGQEFKPVFVSDNPGYDWQWLSYGHDRAGLANPFGFSSRRIGDLAAGLDRNWRKTSAWKRWRKTKHDHNPVNDALGNAEAFETLLRKYDQQF